MKKNQELIRMSYNTDVRITQHFLRVMLKYFPDKKISGFCFSALQNNMPIFEFEHAASEEQRSLCVQKILNTTEDKLIIDHTVRHGSFGFYFVGFGGALDEAVEVILGHYFFYRYVLDTNNILEKIWSVKGYSEGQPYGQLALKFLHEYNEDE